MPKRTATPSSTQDILTSALTKEFGDDLFAKSYTPTGFIPTGLPSLDVALGLPGWPCGRIVTIAGPFGSGKSAILHKGFAECQKIGGLGVLLETEEAIDVNRTSMFGVDVDSLAILQPLHLTELGNIIGRIIDIIEKEDPDRPVLIGWDSVAMTPTERETSEDFSSVGVAEHARVISRMLRKYVYRIAERKICLMIVNQEKQIVGGSPYSDNNTMIAANPLKFASTELIRVTRKANIQGKGKNAPPAGIVMAVEVKKNKLAPPFRRCELSLPFTSDFDLAASWADAAITTGLVKGSGWFTLPDGEKVQRGELGKRVAANADWQTRIRTLTLDMNRQGIGGDGAEDDPQVEFSDEDLEEMAL